MPSKNKPNGFKLFMKHYINREEKAGRAIPGGYCTVKDDPKCNEEWQRLPQVEKDRFKEMAKKSGKEMKKRTGTGEFIDDVQMAQKRELDFKNDMLQDIENTVAMGMEEGDLPIMKFFFIHSNWSYTRKLENGEFEYFPVEFAIAEYSIENGVTNIYHEIIKTDIMIGYMREALETSQETHQIPVPNTLECAEDNFKVMCEKVLKFLAPYKVKGKFPPVYTSRKMNPPVKWLLKKLLESQDLCDETIIVYDLEILISYLRNAAANDSTFEIVMAEHELVKDTFSFVQGLDCDYHKTMDGTSQFCSMSNVKRWAFTICDWCCEKLNINMIEGIHYPKKVNIESEIVDSLGAEMNNLSVKDIQSIKSMTGVSNAHRRNVSERTEKEERKRRAEKTKITIVNYADNNSSASAFAPKPTPIPVPSNSASEEIQMRLRLPHSKSSIASIVGETKQHAFNEKDFPSLNFSSGRGKGNRRGTGENKPNVGRGRGIALS